MNDWAAKAEPPKVAEPSISPFTEIALAERFVKRHPNLRYVAAWGKWMWWTGERWQPDDTLHVFDLARVLVKDVAATINRKKDAKETSNAKTVAAIERLAKADRRIAATADQWDTDPWLLNTPDGVVDLRTGQLRPHRPEDYMTKTTAVGPSKRCPTPLFTSFLKTISKDDAEHILYLCRMSGYFLTGVTREQALFFGHGPGGNGKGVYVKTMSGIMKDYHTQANMDMFMASKNERHLTDLAGLQGARLVTATETERGRQWAEARIKTLTGEDKIRARFMRQDEFTYEATYKLFMIGNNTPRFEGGVDEAMRRRLQMIPFIVKILEPDNEFANKLKAEWPGILQWMIDGCLEWQRTGLTPPPTVLAATSEYLAEEDTIIAWIDDKCERNAAHFEPTTALFASWSAWAKASGETVGSRKDFKKSIIAHGCKPDRVAAARGFKGLRIILYEPPDEPPNAYAERRG